jgi:hypothetical protein
LHKNKFPSSIRRKLSFLKKRWKSLKSSRERKIRKLIGSCMKMKRSIKNIKTNLKRNNKLEDREHIIQDIQISNVGLAMNMDI